MVDKEIAIYVLVIIGFWVGIVIAGYCLVPAQVDVKCSIVDWRVFEGDVRGTGIVGAIYSDINDEGVTLVPVGMDCHAQVKGPMLLIGMLFDRMR